jgi:hypothetical protein
MHEGVTAADAGAERFGLEQVADYGFRGQTFEIAEAARWANEEAKLCALAGEFASDVRSYKSCGSGEKDLHADGVSKPPFYR